MKKTGFLLAFLFFFISVCTSKDTYRSEVIQSTTWFEVKKNRLVRTDSIILQVNERMGDHDAEFGFAYSKGDKVEILYAQIEDLNGNILRKLKKSEIKDQSYISDISLYEDDFIRTFEMRHSTYPYRIHYAVKTTQSKYLQIFDLDLFYQRKPVRNATVIVESSADHPIKYKQQSISTPEIITLENAFRYIWKYTYTPLKHTEVNIDRNSAKIPKLKILPLTFYYGEKGTWESWSTFGNWLYQLNSGRDILPASEKLKIDNLLKGITDTKEKVKAIYRYLQGNVRYINVKIDVGGFQTYSADYVCNNRYGDCKALTNYMQALLKYAGIKSHYTLVQTGRAVSDIDPDFPSQEFNHAILTVPLANDTVFLECTSKNMPPEYIHTGIQGRKSLLIDENNSHLISIPTLKPEEVLCQRNIRTNANRLQLETIQRGERFEESSFLSSGVNKNVLDQYLRNTILPAGTYSLLEYAIDKEEGDNAQAKLKAILQINNIYKQYGNNIIISPFPISLSNYENPEKRVFGVQIDCPLFYEDTISYEILDNTITKVPENVRIHTDFGHYHLNYTVEENHLVVNKSILISAGRYQKEKSYNDFYDFITKIRNYENKNIYIECYAKD